MKEIRLNPPAKINLTLHIIGKRPDGFHELETIMIRTSLTDALHIRLSKTRGVRMTCTDPSIPTDHHNLAVKAAGSMILETGYTKGIEIHLEKHIPAGGGLGGGSSDAAFTLKGLNQLMKNLVSEQRVLELASNLGSDVPFFLGSPVANCRGRGEVITPITAKDLPKRAILINPGFGVPTGWAYKTYAALPPENKRGDIVKTFSWGEMRNDLEPPVFSKYLLLPEIKTWLSNQPGVEGAMMSGSGSTMFGLLKEKVDFSQLKLEFQKTFGNSPFIEEVRLG